MTPPCRRNCVLFIRFSPAELPHYRIFFCMPVRFCLRVVTVLLRCIARTKATPLPVYKLQRGVSCPCSRFAIHHQSERRKKRPKRLWWRCLERGLCGSQPQSLFSSSPCTQSLFTRYAEQWPYSIQRAYFSRRAR